MVERGGVGTCVKCETQISETAKRCPQCGYEPGNSLFGKIIFWVITIPWLGIVVILSLGWLSGAFSGYMPTDSLLISLIFLAIFAAIPVWHYTHYKRQKAMTATGDVDTYRVIQGDGIFGLVYEKLTR